MLFGPIELISTNLTCSTGVGYNGELQKKPCKGFKRGSQNREA